MAEERVKYSWTDDHGRFYLVDGVIAVRFNGGKPEGFEEQTSNGTEYMQKMIDQMLKEPEKIDTVRIEELTLKQIAERTDKTTKRIQLGESAYNPKYIKLVRRLFRDAGWYVNPTKGNLSPLYAIGDEGMAMVMPIRVVE